MDKNLLGQIVFYFFAALTIGSAAVVVFARSLVRSAFALLFTFFGVAALYAYLGADFLAATQMVIYVGGILVLILFGVMLTHKLYDLNIKTGSVQLIPSTIAVVAVFAFLAFFMLRTEWFRGDSVLSGPTTASIGNLLMQDFILPFEAASVLLLLALIGAAMIVRRRSE
ncbi:MAG: NADH-quinone oxidoreductase subunit J [Acidobacteria bacterium]|nr:NADH-quinone oxidoreductase subunit J [Acidobacteriota bacterium]